MPSFDVVSEVDLHELRNAVDQANREVTTRYDFKGSGAKFEQDDTNISMLGETEFQLKQMKEIFYQKLVKRGIDIGVVETGDIETALKTARQKITIRQGIDTDTARSVVKMIKASKIKVQAQIQGEQLRVTGKKRDDLQAVIALLKDAEVGLPLQYVNFRD